MNAMLTRQPFTESKGKFAKYLRFEKRITVQVRACVSVTDLENLKLEQIKWPTVIKKSYVFETEWK